MTEAGSMPTTGRWGRYKDHEGTEFQRVSTLIRKVETDRFGLEQWMKRQVLIGAAWRDDIVLGVKALGRPGVLGWTEDQKRKIGKLMETAEEAAKEVDGATVGTAVHDLTERLDRGEDIDSVVRGLPAQAEMDLRAYAHLIALNAWKVVEIERTVVNDDLGVAGTFDRVYVIPGLTALLGPGTCQHTAHGGDHDPAGEELAVIGDVKTEKDPAKNGLHIGPQLAIYSRARRMWLPAKSTRPAYYLPTPCVRQDVAVAVHIRNGHAVPYFVNLTQGWEAAQAARAQDEREKAAKMWLAPMPNIREAPPATVVTETAVAQNYSDPYRLAPLATPSPATEVAMPIGGGMIGWERVGATTGLDDVDKRAIETAWAAVDLAALGRVWQIYTEVVGRTWGGRVAEAADARRRQIECPQRALHVPASGGRCACGWTKDVPA